MRSSARVFFFALCLTAAAFAKEQPGQILVWPESGTPVVEFTLGKLKDLGSFGKNQHTYAIDTVARNLSSKLIPVANFSLYLFDKNKVRIGEGWIALTNLAPNQSAKFEMRVDTS